MAKNYNGIVSMAYEALTDAQEAVGKVIREARERELPDDAEQAQQALFAVDSAVAFLRPIKERPSRTIGLLNFAKRASSSGEPEPEEESESG